MRSDRGRRLQKIGRGVFRHAGPRPCDPASRAAIAFGISLSDHSVDDSGRADPGHAGERSFGNPQCDAARHPDRFDDPPVLRPAPSALAAPSQVADEGQLGEPQVGLTLIAARIVESPLAPGVRRPMCSPTYYANVPPRAWPASQTIGFASIGRDPGRRSQAERQVSSSHARCLPKIQARSHGAHYFLRPRRRYPSSVPPSLGLAQVIRVRSFPADGEQFSVISNS